MSDVMGLLLVMSSIFAVDVVGRRWDFALVAGPAVPTKTDAWMEGPHAYEAFAAGGVRALIERSPMRYDVAVYGGGGA